MVLDGFYEIIFYFFVLLGTLLLFFILFVVGLSIYLALSDFLSLLLSSPDDSTTTVVLETPTKSPESISPSIIPSSTNIPAKKTPKPATVLCTPKTEKEWKIQSVKVDDNVPLHLFLLSSFSFQNPKKIEVIGSYPLRKPLRTFQIHLYLKHCKLANTNGVMYWGWNKSSITQKLYPLVDLPNVGPDISSQTYTVLQSSEKSIPATLYVRFHLEIEENEKTEENNDSLSKYNTIYNSNSSFGIIVYEDDSSPLNDMVDMIDMVDMETNGGESREEMKMFCIQ
jgi:hypothetical protein